MSHLYIYQELLLCYIFTSRINFNLQVCSDLDDGVNKVLQYTISGGNTAGNFQIDINTGAVSLASALDYETTKLYQLTVCIGVSIH